MNMEILITNLYLSAYRGLDVNYYELNRNFVAQVHFIKNIKTTDLT